MLDILLHVLILFEFNIEVLEVIKKNADLSIKININSNL
jgi:hypothetical protein